MKILLHICCGVCATSVVERLKSEGNKVVGIFYNPNIYPKEEYQKRLDDTKKIAKKMNFKLIESEYNSKKWFKLTEKNKDDPEGGQRCAICFEMRLKYVWNYFKKSKDFDKFTTTLSVSPHKDSKVINKLGEKIGKNKFIQANFKKKDGFLQAIKLSKQWNLYRQNYCGCIYSMK